MFLRKAKKQNGRATNTFRFLLEIELFQQFGAFHSECHRLFLSIDPRIAGLCRYPLSASSRHRGYLSLPQHEGQASRGLLICQLINDTKPPERRCNMNALIVAGLILIVIGLSIALFILSLIQAMTDISIAMPLMRWLNFDQVLALKCCGRLMTRWALWGLVLVEVAQVRLTEEQERLQVDEYVEEHGVTPGHHVEIRVTFRLRDVHLHEYRIRYRPRRRRLVSRDVDEGALVPI